MKTTKSISLIALFITVCIGFVNAQLIPVTGSEVLLDKIRLNKGLEGTPETFYEDVQGDPFIFRNFQKGTLYVLPDMQFEVNIRYDIYGDQMHIKQTDQIYALIHPERVKMIDVDKYRFIYSKYKKSPVDKDPEQVSYFILKADGKCRLLVKKNMRVQQAEAAKLYQDAKAPKFIDTGDSYFLKIGDTAAIRFHDKRELLTLLSDKSDELSTFIKSHKYDVKKINDLVEIISYYNSL